jgi:invasion protein IalB
MKIDFKSALIAAALASTLASAFAAPVLAQQPAPAPAMAPKAKAAAPKAAQAVPAPAPGAAPAAEVAPVAAGAAPAGWAARCTSASREAPLECAMEETAVLSKTGQLVVLVNIRVPGDTRAPILLVQLPLGLSLTAGAKLQVDDGKVTDLPIQTCESRGCYATIPIAADLLTAIKAGKQLKLSLQSMNNEPIVIPMPLGDFAAAYDKIK